MRFTVSETSTDAAETTAAPSRRTMLRGAATAAWAVPAISIASAAPAFAASWDPVDAGASTLVRSANANTATLSLRMLTGAAPLPAGTKIEFFLPTSAFHQNKAAIVTAPAGSWTPIGATFVAVPGNSTRRVYTITSLSAVSATTLSIGVDLQAGGGSNSSLRPATVLLTIPGKGVQEIVFN